MERKALASSVNKVIIIASFVIMAILFLELAIFNSNIDLPYIIEDRDPLIKSVFFIYFLFTSIVLSIGLYTIGDQRDES